MQGKGGLRCPGQNGTSFGCKVEACGELKQYSFNCPVSMLDVSNVQAIFGPTCAGKRWIIVSDHSEAVSPEYVLIKCSLYKHIKNVALGVDVMFMNGIPFFVMLSRSIKLI